MKKQILSFILCLAVLLSLCSCSSEKSSDITHSDTEENTTYRSETEKHGSEQSETEVPHTEAETEIQDETENSSENTKASCLPETDDDRYIFNPYVLSEECRDCFGKEFETFYIGFIDAYMSHKNSCPCPSENAAMNLDMVLNYECPYYATTDISFNWAIDYDYDNHTLSWEYNVDKPVIDGRFEAVKNEMQSFMDKVSVSDREEDKVQVLYHSFCPLMEYAHDRNESREKIEGCYAFTEHKGICVTFSYAFSQILSQVGVYATTTQGDTKSGEGHTWNCVRVNGNYYFFDTTFELNYKNGEAFVYYGMTTEERLTDVAEENIFIGRYMPEEPEIAQIHLNVH